MKRPFRLLLVSLVGLCASLALAQSPATRLVQPDQAAMTQWLARLHNAAHQRAYVGTFVVSSGNAMSAARIWHACDAAQQVERVQALTGVPRLTFRRNQQVMTFLPDVGMAIAQPDAVAGLLGQRLSQADASIARYYRLQLVGRGRVAGLGADIVQLLPLDAWRFGYRIWSEHETGLIIKLQTLDAQERVLEQAAFTELEFVQPLSMAQLLAQMNNTAGFVLKKMELIAVDPDQLGWSLKVQLPGFKPTHRHSLAPGAPASGAPTPVQWVFSDGLASVSLFIEPYRAPRHRAIDRSAALATGATQILTRRLDDWWITAVGEVPTASLAVLLQGLERKK